MLIANRPLKSVGRGLTATILSFTLFACAGLPGLPGLSGGGPPEQARQAKAEMAAGNFKAAAKLYTNLADNAEGTRRAHYLIRTGEAALASGDSALASRALQQLRSASVTAAQRPRGDLLAAGVSLAHHNGQQALQRLPAVGKNTPQDLANHILLVRGKAQFQTGQSLTAVKTLERRNRRIANPQAAREGRALLWQLLRNASLSGTSVSGLEQADATTRGWFALAQIERSVWVNKAALGNRLDAWLKQYPQHPAAAVIVPRVRSQRRTVGTSRGEIALILPLSGRLQTPASAIMNGFLFAYYRQKNAPHPIHVYSPGEFGGIEPAYRQAISDGASAVAGPLSKQSVQTLAADSDTQIPVLAFNYADDVSTLPANFFELGLSPVDEATDLAHRLSAQGLNRALVLVPQGGRGRKIATAFRQALESGGGTVVDQAAFDPSRSDHSSSITYLLQTRTRHGRSKGGSVAYNSARRNDMDFIFLAATPPQARQIRPELRFYHASRVPVYALSSVYTGTPDPAQDRDMNGIRFCTMPWLLDRHGEVAKLRSAAAKLWPGLIRHQPQLFALGYDAYQLLPMLTSNAPGMSKRHSGLTGKLYLGQDGHVFQRHLTCAQFRNGVPVKTGGKASTQSAANSGAP